MCDSQFLFCKVFDKVVLVFDMIYIVFVFEDNWLIGDLFGQFDQNFVLIE